MLKPLSEPIVTFDKLKKQPNSRTLGMIWLVLVWCSLLFAPSGFAKALADNALQSNAEKLGKILAPRPALAPGQSATLLPDGRWLLLGGQAKDGGVTAIAQIFDHRIQPKTKLTSQLAFARKDHSATLMPNGKILILGGIDAKDTVLSEAEEFDIDSGQFSTLGGLGLIPRSGHTATALLDGRLLIAGGKDSRGQGVIEAELFNPQTRSSENFNARLDSERNKHVAALLPNANILIWGGSGNDGNGTVYKTAEQIFDPVNLAEAAKLSAALQSNEVPLIKTTQPNANAQNVPVGQAIMLQFSQRMAVSTLNSDTLILRGPHGVVPVKVVPVEYGMLVFITPLKQLLPASRYTLFIGGAYGTNGKLMDNTGLGFDTEQILVAPPVVEPVPPQPLAGAVESNTGSPLVSSSKTRLTEFERQAIAKTGSNGESEVWVPNASHLKGDWRTKRQFSPMQNLPPLQAPAGETALAGQVLTLNGRGLANAALLIGNNATQTDTTGRFLLAGLAPGLQVLTIDSQTANRQGAEYGVYQVQVKIEAKKTNLLGYPIWSSRLDPAGNQSISSPALQEIVLTTPNIPGLELHIPAGTVIRDRNGKIVTKLNMTAIPTDRAPFPIPNVGVPVYFTIQPGGATLTSNNGRAMKGARLVYPNFSGAAAGTRIDFWNYDTGRKGWYIYGQGTVTADGKQVMPDEGVVIYEFTGAMVSVPGLAPKDGAPEGGCKRGDPVDCFTGLFLHEKTDLFIQDRLPLEVRHSYRPRDAISRAFGIGTSLSYDFYLVGDTHPWTYQDLILPNGTRIHFARTSPGTGFSDAVYEHTSSNSKYFGAVLRFSEGRWKMTMKDGMTYEFPEAEGNSRERRAAVIAIKDRYGNALKLTRDSSTSALTKVTSPSGRFIEFTYDSKNRIIKATDNTNRTVKYEYDSLGRLIKSTNADNKSEVYTYDNNHNMLTVQDYRSNTMVTNTYDANNRVAKQVYADNTSNVFKYTFAADGSVTKTEVTNERGFVTRMIFNKSGYVTSLTNAVGLPEEQTTTYQRDPNTNLVLSMTDALGRKTAYTWDSKGNQLTETRLTGTANAVTASKTYIGEFNRLASSTDFLGRQTNFTYNNQGDLIELKDANGNGLKLGYDGYGQLLQVTNSLNQRINIDYDGFDVSKITDPINRVTQVFADSVGRYARITDPLGNRTTYEYDVLDRVSKMIDPLRQNTLSTYDGNSNQTALTDPKNNLYQFGFDKRDRVISNTDPANRLESYLYDGKSNLIQRTDRKGQVTKYAYDGLDQLTKITYHDASTITMQYDKVNRPKQIIDSINGTIALEYDGLDYVTQVSTPKGKVFYTNYANGLRQSMTVAGQPKLTYFYDPGNRLTRIDQAVGASNNNVAQSIVFIYDAANRRIQTTYANGITRTNTFDDAGQLLKILYKNRDGSVVGDLAYDYDDGGRRTAQRGSLARTALPNELPSAEFDPSNRMTKFGGQTLTYDKNGNLISDGSLNYVWNVRDQLVQIKNNNGVELANFSYDALGRRQTKTVNGVGRGYVYDGFNIVQELVDVSSDNTNAAKVKANYVSGGIDEMFMQLSGNAATTKIYTYLTDALGSTIRLGDAVGNKVVDYTYDPYGKTTADAVVDNPFQYTGRENDGNGLYFYRARYYAPTFARFISNDPIGLLGGINIFSYVRGNPVSRIDPLGLSDVVFNRGAGTITITNSSGNVVGTYPAANNTTSNSNGSWPNGTYDYSHYMPHPESGPNGPYGSNGNFVFDVPGRSGMGIHSGRSGPQSKTQGCIRTTDDATDFLRQLQGIDPLQAITVQ